MTGLVRDGDRRWVDIDDETCAELDRLGGQVYVVDSLDAWTTGRLEHDGERYAIRLDTRIEREAKRVVKIRPRVVLAQGARP